MAKVNKATQLAETDIDLLRSKLRQSFDREAYIKAKGCKAVKTIQDKLDVEVAAQRRTRTRFRKKQTKRKLLLRHYAKRYKKSDHGIKSSLHMSMKRPTTSKYA